MNMLVTVCSFFERIYKKVIYTYYRKKKLLLFNSTSNNFLFDPFSTFVDPQLMSFGENVFINRGAHFSGEISFGKNIMVGPNVTIISHDHLFGVLGKSNRELSNKVINDRIVVNDEVWIGTNVTILKGVKIGMGAIIGSGSIISKNVPPYSIIIGNNKVIKLIFSNNNLIQHLKILGYATHKINAVIESREKLTRYSKLEFIEKTLTESNIDLNSFG